MEQEGQKPVSSDRKQIVQRGYDAVSERYRTDDDDPEEYEGWLDALTVHLPGKADVLDLGCGCGCGVPMTRRLAELGHDVVGVDISSVQITRARRLVPPASSRPTRPNSHFVPRPSTRSSVSTC